MTMLIDGGTTSRSSARTFRKPSRRRTDPLLWVLAMSAFNADFSAGVMQTLVATVAPSLRFPLTMRVDRG